MRDLNWCYRVLELEAGASLEEINQAYKDLVFIWHPDRIPTDNERLHQKAQTKLKELNEARDRLRLSAEQGHTTHVRSHQHYYRPHPRPHYSSTTGQSSRPSTAPQDKAESSKTVENNNRAHTASRSAEYAAPKYTYAAPPQPEPPKSTSAATGHSSNNNNGHGSTSQRTYPQNPAPTYSQKPDLSGADLRGANLKEKDLAGRNLSKADLSNANLSDAFLHRVNLYQANLQGANLFRANLLEANLQGANLRDCNLIGADLSGADLTGADLSGAKIGMPNRVMVKLVGAKLSGATLPDGTVHT